MLNNFVVLGTISKWNDIIDKVNKFYADYNGNLTLAGILTAAGQIKANGGISINNYTLPLFNNGSFSSSNKVVIPIFFTSSSF